MILCKLLFEVMRFGKIEEFFITTQEELDTVKGMSLYFGEELGKHTEFSIPISDKYITVITDDADFINKVLGYGMVSRAYRPWWRILELACKECDNHIPPLHNKCSNCGKERDNDKTSD